MIRLSFILNIIVACMLAGVHSAQQPAPAETGNLDAALKAMDAAAANFRNAQAEFEWDTYEKVIDEVDEVQSGTIYFRRNGKDIEMMAVVKMAGSDLQHLKSEPKYVLYSGGKVSMYQPKPDTLTVYDLGKSRADLESYVVLGFGGSGQDLVKVFDVTYAGAEVIDKVSTAKLQLIPKSDKFRNTYNKIILWIDPEKGISVQQQFFTPQGDYRLTKYSSIQLNQKKISDDVFKLRTTSKTQQISPKG
jgi:outer membrane lipoprotein-sorting protein